MAEFNRKQILKISKKYSPAEREAISLDIVDYILQRTADGKGKGGKKFGPPKGYSKAYRDSTEYKEAGKRNFINLKLTGDMLAELTPLPNKSGEVAYGYEAGSGQLGKAEGNVLGTYGQKRRVAPSRDFMGLTQKELGKILKNYPIRKKEESKSRAELILAIREQSKKDAKKIADDMVAEGRLDFEVAKEIIAEQQLARELLDELEETSE